MPSILQAFKDPNNNNKWSIGRIALAWVIFAQSNIMVGLSAAGLFPANETVKLILGMLAGPALIYAMSTRKESNGNTDAVEDAPSDPVGFVLRSMEVGKKQKEEG